MAQSKQIFSDRYGPWAVVAGAGEGLGAAFTFELAKRGLNVLLIARRMQHIESVATQILSTYDVSTLCLALDLGNEDTVHRVQSKLVDKDLGLLVYNAAHVPLGSFLDTDAANLEQAINVNVRGPLTFVRVLAPMMKAQGRGGIVLMSSLAGLQGGSGLVTYSSTKAFNIILAEGLWRELRESGIDVVTCIAGAVRTPGYSTYSKEDTPGIQEPETVARQALDALAKGPRFVPGLLNRISAQLLTRLLPRRTAISLLANATRLDV